MNDRATIAKYVFALDAVLGILAVGGAALYGAAWSSGNVWVAFLTIFVPFALLYASFCYGAYNGLTSENGLLRFLFWIFVVGNIFAFPVGTAISGVAIWLWRELRAQDSRTVKS